MGRHTDIPKGTSVPQTVEDLQYIMARDAETMQDMRRELGQWKAKVAKLEAKIKKLQRRKS